MKSIIALAFAGFVATVSAQGLSDLPQCALSCLLTGLTATGCDATDFACACSNQSFISSSKTCIDGACQPADQQKALAVAGALCKSAGVTITVPGSEASSSAAASIPAASSSSSAAETTATPTPTPAPTSSAAAQTSAAPTTGGSTESFPSISNESSTVVASTLTTSSTIVVPTGNMTATASSPPLQTTNAGNRLGGMSVVVALGLGLTAALVI